MNNQIIINEITPSVDFLDWISKMNWKIRLESVPHWIKATLVGPTRIFSGYGETLYDVFEAYGKTEEDAISKLSGYCSDREYYPNFRRALGFIPISGAPSKFPRFK